MDFNLTEKTTKKLKALRIAQGLSQSQLAEKCNCSRSLISQIENRNDEDLTVNQLHRYVTGLGGDLNFKFVKAE